MGERRDRVVGGFRILQEIQGGSGSQGTVYKAVCEEDKHGLVPVGAVVALKIMPVQDDTGDLWRKLERRTQELARLEHPNIVRYFGCFSEASDFTDLHVLVLEFLNGKTLKQHLAEDSPSGMDVDAGLRLIHSALGGLNYMAQAGIIHRDIKPGNIFICDDGTVKLIDFEIARQEGGTSVSVSGNIRGSFDYMAPDFTDPEFHGDVQSDIFSLGVVMHEVLTGKTPYQRLPGEEKQANFAFLSRWAKTGDGQIVNPIRISRSIKRLLAHADEVLLRALAPRREERYPDFANFETDFGMIRFRDLKNQGSTYRLLQWIGKGGFGEVFKARFRQTKQLVAIKHLLKADYASRFYREAKTLMKLRDPCFVQFVDFFEIKNAKTQQPDAFLVMAFLPGMPGNSLRDAIRESGTGLPPKDVFLAFWRYAYGLNLMHSQGIFHRDIKPSNLYYPRGNPEGSVIMDFGIIRDVHGTQTKDGGVPGTFDYMPPEVVLTDNRGDARMDIFALGLCLYEALTGKTGYPRLPSGNAALPAFFERAKSGKPPVFDDARVQADHDVLALLCDMTNPKADLREGEIRRVVSRLQKLALKAGAGKGRRDEPPPGPIQPTPEPPTPKPITPRPKPFGEEDSARLRYWIRVAVIAIAVSGGIVGIAFGVSSFQRGRAEEEMNAIVERYKGYSIQEGREAKQKIDERSEAWQKTWNPALANWWKRIPKQKFVNWAKDLADAKENCDAEIQRRRDEIRKIETAEQEAESLVKRFAATVDREGWNELRGKWTSWQGENYKQILGEEKYNELKKKVLGALNDAEARIRLREECESSATVVENSFKEAEGETAWAGAAEKWKRWQDAWKQKLDEDTFADLDKRIQAASSEAKKRIDDESLRKSLAECRGGAEQLTNAFGKVEVRAELETADANWKGWREKWGRESRFSEGVYADIDGEIRLAHDAAERRVVKREEDEKAEQARVERLRKYNETDAAKKEVIDACDQAQDNAGLAGAKTKWDKWRDQYEKWRGEIGDAGFEELERQIRVAYAAAEKRIAQINNEKVKACSERVDEIVQAFTEVLTRGDLQRPETEWREWQRRWTVQMDNAVYQGFDQRIRTARDDADKRITEAEAARAAQEVMNGFAGVKNRDELEQADGDHEDWKKTWRLKLDGVKFDELDKEIQNARAAADERVKKAEAEQLLAQCRQEANGLAAAYGRVNTRDDLAKTDGDRAAWQGKWKGKVGDRAAYDKLDGQVQAVRDAAEARVKAAEERQMLAEFRKGADGLIEEFGKVNAQDALEETAAKHSAWQKEWKGKLDENTYAVQNNRIRAAHDAAEKRVIDDLERQMLAEFRKGAAGLIEEFGNVNTRDALEETAVKHTAWQDEWKGKVNAEVFAKQNGLIQEERNAAEKRIRDAEEKAEAERRCKESTGTLTRAFQAVQSRADLVKQAAVWQEWRKDWKGKVDEGLFAGLDKIIQEARDEVVKRIDESDAKAAADGLVGEYEKVKVRAELEQADGKRTMWQNAWKQKLDANVYAAQDGKVQKARDAAEQLVQNRERMQAECQDEANAISDAFAKVVRNGQLEKADAEREKWQDAWKQKLDADAYAKLDGMIGRARGEAAKRVGDLERRLKECADAAETVARTFRSVKTGPGLDRANGEWTAWQTKWKELEGQPEYANAVAAIQKALDDAKKRLEEIEEMRNRVQDAYERALQNEPMEERGKRLEDAKGMLNASKRQQLFSEEQTEQMLAEIEKRQAWTVGKIVNRTGDVLSVGGTNVAASAATTVVFEKGTAWTVTRRGYDPVRVKRENLNGQTVVLADDAFTPSDVTVKLPDGLDAGVVCEFSGKDVSAVGVAMKPGRYTCAYRRAGYDRQEGLSFTVAVGADDARFPLPGKWVASPVKVTVPKLEADVTCEVDGTSRKAGETFQLLPGNDHSYVYRKTGWKDQSRSLTLRVGENTGLPKPTEWEPLPVKVTVPKLEEGVTCEVDGEVRKAGETFELTPRAKTYAYVYRKTDYEDQTDEFTVEVNTPFTLAAPVEWKPTAVLQNLNDAVAAVNAGKWTRAEDLLKKADVRDAENLKRKGELTTQVENAKKWEFALADISELVDQLEVDYDMVLKMYGEIHKQGFRLRDIDKERIQNAYKFLKEDLEGKKGGNHFNDQDVDAQLRKLEELYNRLK